MEIMNAGFRTKFSYALLRIAISGSMLSAVADRFGVWGPPGASGVVWGDFAAFESHTAMVAWYVPASLIPTAARLSTGFEVLLPLFLLTGFQLKRAALVSAYVLGLVFVLMVCAVGVKAPLDYSLLIMAAGLFVLGFSGKA